MELNLKVFDKDSSNNKVKQITGTQEINEENNWSFFVLGEYLMINQFFVYSKIFFKFMYFFNDSVFLTFSLKSIEPSTGEVTPSVLLLLSPSILHSPL